MTKKYKPEPWTWKSILLHFWRSGYYQTMQMSLDPDKITSTQDGKEWLESIMAHDAFSTDHNIIITINSQGLEVLSKLEDKPDNYREVINQVVLCGVLDALQEKIDNLPQEVSEFLSTTGVEFHKLLFENSLGLLRVERTRAIFNL